MQKKSLYLAISLIAMMFLLTSVVPTNAWVYPDCTSDENFEKFGPRADKLLIKLYPDDTSEFLALEKGEIDIVDWPLTHAFKMKWKNPPYNNTIKEVSYGADLGYNILDINNNATQPDGTPNPTSENELRHAIAHCVNKTRLVDECLAGQGYPLWSLVGPAWAAYTHPEIKPGGDLCQPKTNVKDCLCHFLNCTEARRILKESPNFTFVAGPGKDGIASDPAVTGEPADHLEWHIPPPHPDACTWVDVQLKFVIRGDDPRRTCAGDIIADALEDCLGIQVSRVYLDSSGAFMQVMVSKHFNLYTGGWSLGYDPDWMILYNIRYYWHPGFCYNYGHVNCPAFNYHSDIVESPNDVAEAIEHAMKAQEALADPDCVGIIPLFSVEGTMAHWRCYSGGTGGEKVYPDDGENQYRCQNWKGLVNPAGIGITSWWSFLNMYPEDHQMGDCENMTIRWGFRVPDHRELNPVYSSWLYDWNVLGMIYDSLIVRDPYHPAYWMPYIAKNWTVGTWEVPPPDPDAGAIYTKVKFTLRTDVCWSDGYPLTVEDVKFTIVDLAKMLIARGCPPPWWYSNVAFVRSCYVLDACNIELLLETKSVWALGWMGGNVILPKHIWKPLVESVPLPGDTGPHTCEEIQGFSPDYYLIGSGPWRFREYVKGSHDLLTANKPCSVVDVTIGTDTTFSDVHPHADVADPWTPVHSKCGYFWRKPKYVDVHTAWPLLYEYRQRFPPCTPVYFKVTEHTEWKNTIPNSAYKRLENITEFDPAAPVCSYWHEYEGGKVSHIWHIEEWTDNPDCYMPPDGMLGPCDKVLIRDNATEDPDAKRQWWHVEKLEEEDGSWKLHLIPQETGMLIVNKWVKLEVHECQTVKFPQPSTIYIKIPVELGFPCGAKCYVSPSLPFEPEDYKEYESGEQVEFPSDTYIGFTMPTRFKVKNETDIRFETDPLIALNGEQMYMPKDSQLPLMPCDVVDIAGGSWIHFQEETTVNFPVPTLVHYTETCVTEPLEGEHVFPECTEIDLPEGGKIHFKHEVQIGIKEKHYEEEPYCEYLYELLGPFLFSKSHYKLKVKIHIKGPENITTSKECLPSPGPGKPSDVIEKPNPWVCTWINVTYHFWSTIPFDITGDATNPLGMPAGPIEGKPHMSDIYEQLDIPDCKVRVDDVLAAALAFGSNPGHPRWDSIADINHDRKVRVDDILAIALSFGWPERTIPGWPSECCP